MNKSKITFAPAAQCHGPVIAVLHAACFGQHAWAEDSIAEVMAMPGSYGHLAVEDGSVTGFVLARAMADECEVLSIGVIPACRRRGLARGLLLAALEQARSCGARWAHLEVAEDDGAACRLYLSQGFQRVGSRPAYYERTDGASCPALLLRYDLAYLDLRSDIGGIDPSKLLSPNH